MQTTLASFYPIREKKKLSFLDEENRYIDMWLIELDAHDKGARDHSYRVANAALSFAEDLKVGDGELLQFYRGALLHDIGKLFIPEQILNKPGSLTDEEWKIIRRHPEYAYQFLSNIYFLQKSIVIPYFHHERWNGGGYPCGLKGEAIPLEARLFAIIDVWDSLSYDRCYNSAWPPEKIAAYLAEQAGSLFDPRLVERFLLNEQKYKRIACYRKDRE